MVALFFFLLGCAGFDDIDCLYMFFFLGRYGETILLRGGFLVFFCFSVLFYRGRGVFFRGRSYFYFFCLLHSYSSQLRSYHILIVFLNYVRSFADNVAMGDWGWGFA